MFFFSGGADPIWRISALRKSTFLRLRCPKKSSGLRESSIFSTAAFRFPHCICHRQRSGCSQFLNWSAQLSAGQLHFIVQIESSLFQKKKDIHTDVLPQLSHTDPIWRISALRKSMIRPVFELVGATVRWTVAFHGSNRVQSKKYRTRKGSVFLWRC